jgi:hypothetical protein
MNIHIYAAISFLMIILFLIDIRQKSDKSKKIIFYIGAFVVTFLLAFRGDYIGGDTDSYCGYFDGRGGTYGTLETQDSFEWGFRVFCRLLANISRSHFWFLFSTSLVTILPFLYLVKRDTKGSKMLPLCLYMLVWSILSVTQTAIRQNLSVSCIMLAYIIWTTESYKIKYRYFIIVFLLVYGFLSHRSSLIALPLLLVAMFIPFTKKTALITVVSSLLVVMMFKNIFGDIFDLFNQYMMGVEIAQHMLNVYYENSLYALDSEVSFNRLGPTTLLVCLLICMSREEEFKSPYLRFIIVGASLYNIGATFPMIFRTLYALLLFGIIYCPTGINLRKNMLLRIVLIMLLLFFVRIQIVSWKANQDNQMLPYNFIWEDNRIKN